MRIPAPVRSSRGSPELRVALALALFTFALYARSLASDLVYDGRTQILEDDFIHQPGNLVDVVTLRVLARDVLDNNRPAQLLSLMLDALVWGRRGFGFHLTSVLLHVLCVVLLFSLLRRRMLAGGVARPRAALAAGLVSALFAAHPLCVEAVAEPSYREDLLVGVFLLTAVWWLGQWGGGLRGRDLARVVAIVAAALGAVAAKESGVAVVPILLTQAFFVRRDAPPAGPTTRALVVPVAAVVLVAAGFCLARQLLLPRTSIIFSEPPGRLGGSLAATFAIEPRILVLHLLHIAWPVDLSADYTPGSIAGISLPVAPVVLLALVAPQAWAILRGAARAGTVLGIVWFWATLLPASNLIPIYRPAADRYLYVPLLGLALWVSSWVAARGSRALGAIAVVVIAALGLLSLRRQAVFASELALWQDTLRATPDSITAMDNQGWALLEAGRTGEAQAAFVQAARAGAGHDPDPLAGIALAAFALGQREQAARAVAAAVARDQRYADPEALRPTLRYPRAVLERWRALLTAVATPAPPR